jgi:hypothetical protein
MADIVCFAPRGIDARLMLAKDASRLTPLGMKPGKLGDIIAKARKIIHEIAMRAWVDHRAIGVLAVDFDERGPDGAQRLHGNRLVVHIGARAAISHLHAAQDEITFDLGTSLPGGKDRPVIGREIENRRHLPLHRARAHERAIAAPAQCQRQRIEQDGLARAGFARENGKALPETKVQPLDQNDIADREPGEHGVLFPAIRGRPRGPSNAGSC